MPESNKKLINVREAAKECGRNMETVRRWIWAGKLPAEKLGNQLFIKKSDFASFCRETAVKGYEAKPKPDFLKRVHRERATALRNRMKARGVTAIDAAEEIRKLREERMNESELNLQGDTTMKYGTEDGKKEDFLERAIRFQNKLRARGYPEVDTVELVKKSREGRMRELRQSLR